MAYSNRETKILELLDFNDKLTYRQLMEALDVSEATVRRDLAKMEKEKLLIRYWGGARRNPDRPLRARNILEGVISEEQHIIGEIAAEFVENDELIFMGSGLTTLTMIDYIEAKKITVITNGIPQLEALKRKDINAFLLCGFLKEYSRAVVGPQTVDMLSTYHFDRAFVGVNGLGKDLELLSQDGYEYEIKQTAMNNSRKSFILADHTKLHHSAMYSMPVSQTNNATIISDRILSENFDWKKEKRGYYSEVS